MKHITHLFLDFDETLFNHSRFLDWVDNFLVEHHQIEPAAFKSQIDAYHVLKAEKLRLYRHEAHIEAVTQRRWSFLSAELEKALKQRKRDFCYPEAHATLKRLVKLPLDIRLLTYGDGAYQRFKLNTCSLLSQLRLPVHVVDEPKRLFLEREFPKVQGILVDDKYPLRLPPNWQHVWINRHGVIAAEKLAANEHIIASLAELDKVV
jgi:hypothetical protein